MGFTRTSVVYATPDLTLGAANAAGSVASAIRSDSTVLVYDTTVPTTIAFGASAAAGDTATAAHRNHTHGMASETAVPAATQVEMEAGSSTSVFVTPGRQQYHPGSGKAWAHWQTNTSHTLFAHYNIASISDPGVGQTVLNFDVDFSDADGYASATLCSVSGSTVCSPPATDSITIHTFSDASTTYVDSADNNIICMGDQ